MAMEWVENEDGTKTLMNTEDAAIEQACPTDPMEALQCTSCQ